MGGSLSFNVDGGAGHDLVQIDDSGSLALRNYTLGAGNVIGIFGGLANTSVESVELRAGAGADGFSIGTTTATTTLLGGAGADTFVIANNGGLNGGLLDGEGGNDTLDLSLFTTTVQFEPAATREMFLARVSGAQESSPLSTSPATATLVATLDPGASALAFRMPYRDVAGATITFGQFHAAKTGLNGAPVRSLNGTELNGALVPAGTFFGIWASIDAQPLGAANLSSLRANRIYLNVFTNLFPSGELRGQLIAQGVVGLATGTGGVRNVEILDQSMFANGFE